MKRKAPLLLAALFLAMASRPEVSGQEARPLEQAYLEAGQKIYRDAPGDCGACHGWNGTGRSHDHIYAADYDAGGPSLSLSAMTREEMIHMVSCGRVASGGINVMPQYRSDAWTPSYPCWGKLAADMPADQRPLRTGWNLTQPQIEAVVDYVQDAYQGKLMSWDWCSTYFDDFKRMCEVWRDHGAE